MQNQVVCLSTTNYHPLPTRKQNVMSRLTRAEILYFDPPVSIVAPLKDKKASERIWKFKEAGEKVQENITVYALPPVLPFFNKVRFINKINQFFQARYVRKKMKAHGFDKPVLWCYSPSSADIVSHVPHEKLVYDCVDRHSAYKGMINPVVVDGMEKQLAEKADMVFSTAAGLHETLSGYNKNAVMIPNGCAYEIFSKANEAGKLACPEILKGKKHPIFGFVGMLQECIDYDLIEELAQKMPDATIFFIGRPLPGVNLDRFKCYSNVVFNGLVPQPELPKYIAQFDVCLNVFREGALSKDVSPLKFYEYLATGKPIVSTREPLQVMDFADVVYVCPKREDFVALCRQAAEDKDEAKQNRRLDYGKACSWTERVHQMEAELYKRKILQK